MPKPATHALTWCPDTSTSTYTVRDPEHDQTLAAIFGDILTFTPGSQEWFGWLASISSFAFEGREGRFTARCETKQRGERYWVAYQRVEGKLLKRYIGKTGDLTATKLEDTAGSISSARPALVNGANVQRFLSRNVGIRRECWESRIGCLNIWLQKGLATLVMCKFTAG
jgi:hypothetical protein